MEAVDMGADYKGKMEKVPTGLYLIAIVSLLIAGLGVLFALFYLLVGTILTLTIIGAIVGIPLIIVALVNLFLDGVLFLGAVGVFMKRKWGYYVIFVVLILNLVFRVILMFFGGFLNPAAWFWLIVYALLVVYMIYIHRKVDEPACKEGMWKYTCARERE